MALLHVFIMQYIFANLRRDRWCLAVSHFCKHGSDLIVVNVGHSFVILALTKTSFRNASFR